jgi:serine-aspartate repeat-containing protein C/D/E
VVEYQYKVTSPLTNSEDVQASVVDDPNGDGDLSDEVAIATNITLAPGESRIFFDTRTLYGTTTNIATAKSAAMSSVTCTPAMDSVNVTVTAPPAGPFDCKDAKPIDGLTMEWAGLGEDVCVRAWDGAVGGTQLGADQDDVALGDLVTVSGMGGSPNDQYWQIFAAGDCGGEEIGQSTFHISCSDSSMNGAEDCGKIQGDGKDNTAGMINTWLLEAMVGDDGALECSGNETIIPDLCGFGPELLLALPGLLWLHRRRLRREA